MNKTILPGKTSLVSKMRKIQLSFFRLNKQALRLLLLAALIISLIIPTPVCAFLDLDADPEVDFALITDFGTCNANAAKAADLVLSANPNFIVTAGDNWQYYDLSAFTVECPDGYASAVGQYYSDYYQAHTLYPVPGNHDYYAAYPNSLTEYLAYFDYLPPEGSDPSATSTYYDFVKGPVHFFMIDSGMAAAPADLAQQQEWLKKGLERSLKLGEPWQIVVFHKPAFSGGSHGSTDFMQWPFGQWGADYVISGHNHIYERIYRDGVRYFTAGVAGGDLRGGYAIPGLEAAVYYTYGYIHIKASAENIRFDYVGLDGIILDSYSEWLTKKAFLPLFLLRSIPLPE